MKEKIKESKKIYYIFVLITALIICCIWFLIIKLNGNHSAFELKKKIISSEISLSPPLNEPQMVFDKDNILDSDKSIPNEVESAVSNKNDFKNLFLLNLIIINFLRDVPSDTEINMFIYEDVPFNISDIVKLISDYNVILTKDIQYSREVDQYNLLWNMVKITKFSDYFIEKDKLRKRILDKLDTVYDYLCEEFRKI